MTMIDTTATIPPAPDDHLYGYSYYSALHGCLRRAAFGRAGGDGGEDADFGTALHGWLAAYHQQRALPALSEDAPPRSCSPAECARRYAALVPPDGYGEVQLTEQRLGVEDLCGWGEPYRGTLDAVACLDDATVAGWQDRAGLQLQPGCYLIDYKTKKQTSEMLIPSLMGSPQFTGYHLVWQAVQPDVPLLGTLVVVLFRYVNDPPPAGRRHVLPLLVPPPDQADVARLRTVVIEGAERRRRLGDRHMSPARCFDFGRVCPVLDAEGCERYNLPPRG